MKRILLGLLALSTTLMATGQDNAQIDIETKAFIVNSGLIITGTQGGSDSLSKVELDHGTIMAGVDTGSRIGDTVYIRKTSGTNFPENTKLEIALEAPAGNNLMNGTSSIPHTLSAAVNRDNATVTTGGEQTLSISGDNTESTDTFTVKNVSAIEVALNSNINPGQFSADLAEGVYTNASTLSVKFSKTPGSVTQQSR